MRGIEDVEKTESRAHIGRRLAALAAAGLLLLSACGDSGEAQRIGREDPLAESAAGGAADAGQNAEEAGAAGQEAPSAQEDSGAAQEADADAGKGYVFRDGGAVIAVDEPMAPVLEVLGEPVSYYEAASCAFEGLDKIYTYEHYRIETYPQGEDDRISIIYLKDDIVTTPEGLYIGAGVEDMLERYGDSYEEDGLEYIYRKDGMKLMIIVTDGIVTSITYSTSALDEG